MRQAWPASDKSGRVGQRGFLRPGHVGQGRTQATQTARMQAQAEIRRGQFLEALVKAAHFYKDAFTHTQAGGRQGCYATRKLRLEKIAR